MNLWSHRLNSRGAKIVVDRDHLTRLLEKNFGDDLDAAARQGMAAARSALPDPLMKAQVSFKGYRNTPHSLPDWPTHSMRLPALMRGMRIPVALVTINTGWAYVWEWGQLQPTRADKSKFTDKRHRKWRQQYRPMAAALSAMPGKSINAGRDPRRRGRGMYHPWGGMQR